MADKKTMRDIVLAEEVALWRSRNEFEVADAWPTMPSRMRTLVAYGWLALEKLKET